MRVGGAKYIIQDNLGSTAVTTNGTVAESRLWYNPFGELYNYWGTIPTDKRFTGQQVEYETEPPNQWNAIYDYGARMYDAKIGRMLQPDAFFDPYNPQSLNRYSYVLNNPLRYTDPTGMYPADMTPAEWGRILRPRKEANLLQVSFAHDSSHRRQRRTKSTGVDCANSRSRSD